MTKISGNDKPIINDNLKNVIPFRGSEKGKAPSKNVSPQSENKPAISEEAKKLNEQRPTLPSGEEAPPSPAPENNSNLLSKTAEVASKLAQVPTLPLLTPSIKPLEINKVAETKTEKSVELLKKPSVIFIEGFTLFGMSNGNGLKDMSDNFPDAKHFNWNDHKNIMAEIKKHDPNSPLVLVGHSFGGDTAVEIANELNTPKHQFRQVDLLVSLDSVGIGKSIIPVNVKHNMNYFVEGIIPFLHGEANVARNSRFTTVENELRPELHSKIDDSPEVQFQIFNKIKEVIGMENTKADAYIEIDLSDLLDRLKSLT